MVEEWIDVKDKLPTEHGQYLVIRQVFGKSIVDILGFSMDLYNLDKYDFSEYGKKRKTNRKGWYDYDSEYGYLDYTKNVVAWMSIPKIPENFK